MMIILKNFAKEIKVENYYHVKEKIRKKFINFLDIKNSKDSNKFSSNKIIIYFSLNINYNNKI